MSRLSLVRAYRVVRSASADAPRELHQKDRRVRISRTAQAFVVIVLALWPAAYARSMQKINDLSRCGNNSLFIYSGKGVADVQRLNLANARFVCIEGCLATADVREDRLTVVYSRKTHRVIELFCG